MPCYTSYPFVSTFQASKSQKNEKSLCARISQPLTSTCSKLQKPSGWNFLGQSKEQKNTPRSGNHIAYSNFYAQMAQILKHTYIYWTLNLNLRFAFDSCKESIFSQKKGTNRPFTEAKIESHPKQTRQPLSDPIPRSIVQNTIGSIGRYCKQLKSWSYIFHLAACDDDFEPS